jgi:hypothetical protein
VIVRHIVIRIGMGHRAEETTVGIRETLNKQPAIVIGAAIGVILLALIFLIYQVIGPSGPRLITKAYYTADDGASYFPDDIGLVPPFDHDGKQAVKAYVFKGPGVREFVGYLERYTDDAKKMIESDRARGGAGPMDPAMATGVEVKAPLTGDQGWVKGMLPAADKIRAARCPDDSQDIPQPVTP